jgi:hypothetical protein
MTETNTWYQDIEKKINSLKEKISGGDEYLYDLDLLLKTAKKVDELSNECMECRGNREEIIKLITVVENLPGLDEAGEIPKYSKSFERIIKHLNVNHRYGKPVGNVKLWIGLSLILIGLLVGVIGISLFYDGGSMRYFGEFWMVIFATLMLMLGGLVFLLWHWKKL